VDENGVDGGGAKVAAKQECVVHPIKARRNHHSINERNYSPLREGKVEFKGYMELDHLPEEQDKFAIKIPVGMCLRCAAVVVANVEGQRIHRLACTGRRLR